MNDLNLKVVFVLGIAYGVGRFLVDQLSLLAFPHCDHPIKCFDYAEELAASVHPRVNPCDNLYDHVCGKWDRLHPFLIPASGGQFRVLSTRMLAFALRQLERSPPEHPVLAVSRSISAFQSCSKVYAERRDETQVLFDVFKKFNFKWPSLTLPTNFDLMEYLLGMSFEYNLATPVLLSLTPDLKTDKRYGLLFDISSNVENETVDTKVIASCISSVAPLVSGDLASKFAKRIHTVFLNLFTAQTALFRNVRPTLLYTTIEKLANDTSGHSTGETWLKVINNHLPHGQAVSESEDVLTITNSGLLLRTILDDAKRSGYADLVLYAGWNMLVSLRAAVSPSLVNCMDGSSTSGQLPSTLGCLGSVTQVASFALGRFVIDSLELHRNINHTRSTWNALRKATRESFANLSWMDKSTAKGAVEHVDSLITVLPLPKHLQTNEALEAHYGFLDPNVSQPFIHWLFKTKHRRLEEQKRLFKGSTVTVYRDDIYYNTIDVNAFYISLMHIMAILPGIMAAPFVPQEVPATLHYGAIGKVLGHELTHAFDPLFSNFTRTGEVGTWWSKKSFDNFRGRLECLRRQLQSYTDNEVHSKNALSEAFADTAGTEKAWLAFTSLPAEKGVLGYTQEQSFFIASCFEFCSEGGYQWQKNGKYPAMVLRCNIPARNEKEFAAAFSCPTGSAMNPEKRCTFH
ncbi:endothelin-converting enzyme homolog [Dermacentor silvarum]|uniref:endothelin-converting enzyme homolog n=1 Tax=Dermacentor silvarum TaxID=543639 RepID=UPI0021007693|nr:endothelin-converting enzyme homolog [Dermacentor silvarum]